MIAAIDFDWRNLHEFVYFAIIPAKECLDFVNDTPLIVCYT